MANITELIKNVRNAIYGKDVRESIAKSIEQCYEDASKKGNSNMEVSEARGDYDTLKKRLEGCDDKIAEKRDKNTNIKMTDLAQDVKEAMTGGSVAVVKTNAVDESNIKNKVINANKTNFLKIGKNKFNYQNVQEYMTINGQGELISSPNRYLVSEKIYTGDATNLTVSYVTSSNNQILLDNAIIAFYDSNSQYISKLTGAKVSIPENAHFCYCVLNTSYAEGDARQRVQIELEAEMSKFERYYEKLNDNIVLNDVEVLNQRVQNIKDIQSKIVLKDIKKIKIIGDSITHGVGGAGFTESYGDGDTFLIVDELDTEQGGRKFKVNTTGQCWANSLKNYLENKFASTVSNWGNRGMSAGRWMNMGHIDTNGTYKKCIEQLIENDDDLVICTIGTNDRTYDTYNNYIIAMQQLIDYIVNTRNKQLILVSSIPASIENETNGTQKFHMEDVDNAITALARKNNLINISLYRKFSEYCNSRNITIDSLLSDGLHPNDTGYEVMFKLMCEELEIATKREGATW